MKIFRAARAAWLKEKISIMSKIPPKLEPLGVDEKGHLIHASPKEDLFTVAEKVKTPHEIALEAAWARMERQLKGQDIEQALQRLDKGETNGRNAESKG